MDSKTFRNLGRIAFIVFLCFSLFSSLPLKSTAQDDQQRGVLNEFYSMSIPFVEAPAQIRDTRLKYLARTLGAGFGILEDGEIVHSFVKTDGQNSNLCGIREFFSGSLLSAPIGENKTNILINEYNGKDPSLWARNVSAYSTVNLGEIYKGINLRVRAFGNGFEKIFYLNPQAKPDSVNIQIEGDRGLRVNENGDLEVETGFGVAKFLMPVAYQEENGVKRQIKIAYRIIKSGYSFSVGEYDPSKPVFISSTLIATLFTKGFPEEINLATLRDGKGQVYMAGTTPSLDVIPSASVENPKAGSTDVFIARMDAGLNGLNALTFVGGSQSEDAFALAADNNGNVYLTGSTESADFPTTPGVFATSNRGSRDVFIAKFGDGLNNLLASTLLGGSGSDVAYAIAVGINGDVYVGGGTASSDFPTTPDVVGAIYNGGEDGFLSRLDSDLRTLLSSSFLGGTGDDRATSISIDKDGNVSITGSTLSNSFPTPFGRTIINPEGSSSGFTATFDPAFKSYLSFLPYSAPVPDSGSSPGQNQVVQDVQNNQSISSKSNLEQKNDMAKSKEEEKGDSSADDGGKIFGPLGPGWFMAEPYPVSRAEAEAYYRKKRAEIESSKSAKARSGGGIMTPMFAETPSSEIQELARGLRYDPKLIYDYVHNHIDYVPYFGSLKGAALTYLDGSGNDFDQASLMISLLRESGYTAQYVYGSMTIPILQLANWVGVDPNAETIQAAFRFGGCPPIEGMQNGETGTVYNRVWVKATIDGIDYLFDPAFKSYEYFSKIDIGQAMGYSQANFMNATNGALAGATVTSDYVQNMNETNINNFLSNYSSNLINTIRTQYPNSDVDQIIGGRRIVQTELTSYQTSLPFPTAIDEIWTDTIPDDLTTKLRIQHVGIDYTFNTPDLSGKRLTLVYAGANNNPEIRQDGTLIASGNPTNIGSKNELIITIDHPFVYIWCDQTVTYMPESGRSYAVAYNFGGISDALLRKRQQQLDNYRAQGMGDTSEPVLGETLHIMAQTWLKEVAMANRLIAGLAETISFFHHNVGLMSQEAGYYIDVKAGFVNIASKHNLAADRQVHFKIGALVGSAFEHGMLEQLMGSGNRAVSTMKLFQIANSTGRKIFSANSSNYTSIRPQLQYYSIDDLNAFQDLVNNGHTLILPDNGEIVLNSWKGKGYIDKTSTGMGMIIGGNYFGGYNAVQGSVNPPVVSQTATVNLYTNPVPSTAVQILSPQTTPTPSIEPVDMASGAYLYDQTDLQVGGGAPLGLAFARAYNSNLNLSKRSLGYGWTHNYDIYVTPSSHGEPVLGNRQPVDAAGMISAIYVCLDLLKTQDSIQYWVAASIGSKWAIDQAIDNAATVNLGNKVMEFIKLPDGTYASPPGIVTQLVKNVDGTFSLLERFGTHIDFNADKKVSQITDVDGNTMHFNYTGTNLTTVQDAFNRTLTIQYSSGKISSVTDSANPARSVSYGYDGNDNLTTYTDPEAKTWGYGYSDPSSHRMTSLTNPLSITTATNVYDTQGRVMTQTVPRQGTPSTVTYNFYFSGYRNAEEDPLGNVITYFYDQKGREYAIEDALGNRTMKEFDGQNHVVQVTDSRQNVISFQYDGNHNLRFTTDPLQKTTENVYDLQFRLTDIIDPLTHTIHFDYDSEHHLIRTTDAEGNYSEASYYANGLKETSTDGRGVVTAWIYGNYGNPETVQTGSHPAITYAYDLIGRLTNLQDQIGSATSFTYDKRNLLTTKTDPLLRGSVLTYDNGGRLLTATDRNSLTLTYSYTPTGKVDHITYPDQSTISFAYNQLDQLTSVQNRWFQTSYTSYDAAGRLKSVTNPYNFVVAYDYDEVGNLTEITYTGNKKVIYTYDELNRLKTVKIDWLAGQPTATYYYDDAGRLTGLTNFNGTVTSYGYDTANRLTSLENRKSDTTVISTYEFTLDGNGGRTQVIQEEPLSPGVSAPGATAYDYNTAKNRLLTAGGDSFTYDYEGQLASGRGVTYAFDYYYGMEHTLSTIGNSHEFYYDAMGRRIEAVRSGATTRYVYDEGGNLILEADGDNSILRYYVHGLGLMAMVTPEDQVYCYHYDAIGSTVAMTDSSQTAINIYAYDPFGNILGQEESIDQPFKYVGQYGVMAEYNDNLYYMRARYYDPKVGRFILEDPIGFKGGNVNLSVYVGNNPVMLADPTGKKNPIYHFIDGWKVGRKILNYGMWDSFKLAVKTAWVDFSEMNNMLLHANTKEREADPRVVADNALILAKENWRAGKYAEATHTLGDIPTHAGAYYPGMTLDHFIHDLTSPGSFQNDIVSKISGFSSPNVSGISGSIGRK